MIGHPTDLIQLSDGRIMATYGLRPVHARPGGIRACFSNDNGETFDIRTEPHHEELPVGRFVAMKKTNAVRVFVHVSFVARAPEEP
jgi:hypothetical protein